MWKRITSSFQGLTIFLSCLGSALCLGIDTTCQFKPDGLYRHGSSCKRFIHCAHGRPFYKVCPIFLEFNERTKVCDIPSKARCNVRLASATKLSIKGNECKGRKYSVIGIPNDCQSYIMCINGKKIEKKCPTGLRFHPKYKVCVYGKSSDCLQTGPFCERRSNGAYSHPKSCQNYILCTSGMSAVKKCPPLMVFDAVKRRCAWKWTSFCRVESAKDPSAHLPGPISKQTLQHSTQPPVEHNFSPLLTTVSSPNEVHWKEIGSTDRVQPHVVNPKQVKTTSPLTTRSLSTTKSPRTTPMSSLAFLQGLKFAMLKKQAGALPNPSQMQTYVISGQGYPAVPVKDQRYELMKRLKKVRINVHGLKKTQALMKEKNFNSPIKVLDISYETNTLAPVVLASSMGKREKLNRADPKQKSKIEFKEYIKSMNEQVKHFSTEIKRAESQRDNRKDRKVKRIQPKLQNRKVISRLLKDFLKGQFKPMKSSYSQSIDDRQKPPKRPLLPLRRPDQSSQTQVYHKRPTLRPWLSLHKSNFKVRTAERLEKQQIHFSKETQRDQANPQLPDLNGRKGFVVSGILQGSLSYAKLRKRAKGLVANKQAFSRETTLAERLSRQPNVERRGQYPKSGVALRAQKSTQTRPLKLQSKLDTICSDIFDPVCGSDFQTYFNDCHLALTSCNRNKRNPLKKLHDGPCQTKL